MKTHFIPFIHSLENYRPFDAVEAVHLDTLRRFVSENSDVFWQRTFIQGHVTGSAFVVNEGRSHTLLLFHAKLNRWVQPGGHLDDSDQSPSAGALREAIEETGIASLTLEKRDIFDIDVHRIPFRSKDGQSEPAHFHHDVRYLVIAKEKNVRISAESLGYRWVPLTDLADRNGSGHDKDRNNGEGIGSDEPGLVRMANKLLHA